MTRVHVDSISANMLMRGQQVKIDQLDAAISNVPVAMEIGEAAQALNFLLTAMLESVAVASESVRTLYVVAQDALGDLAAHDRDTAETLERFQKEVFEE